MTEAFEGAGTVTSTNLRGVGFWMRSIMMRALTLVMALGAALGQAGCLIGYDPDSVDFANDGSTEPLLIVVSPAPNAQIGDELVVELTVENITLVNKVGQANVEGEGHLAVFIDDVSITPADQGITSVAFRITVTSLSHGETDNVHRLRVEARNNDGSPYPGVSPVTVEFIKLPPS